MRQIPREIQAAMDRYDMGLIPQIPPAWSDYHKELAEELLEIMKTRGVRVFHTEMIQDAWFDELEVVSAIVETQDGELVRVKWDCAKQRFLVRHSEDFWDVPDHDDLRITL